MKKIAMPIIIILLSISILACAFAETVAGQVLTDADAQRQDAENSVSAENTSSQSIPKDSSTDTALVSDQITDGFYLFAPTPSTETYLMDSEGVALYTWSSSLQTGQSVYLLENGNLLRTGKLKTAVFDGTGFGGVIQEIAPDGSVVWEFTYANDQVQQHHDIELMPNGNILMIAWEYKTEAEAIAAGRDPKLLKDGQLWPDHIIEVDPTTNDIVWEWHIWDHLIQDYDPTKENYGVVADHPELIDLNFIGFTGDLANWQHSNAIDYNAETDQILLSVRNVSEIWIIDHNTTTEEAAELAGDLLYRWGNPEAYDTGTAADRQLFLQHDAEWIPVGLPGEGNILVFNNGDNRLRPYSSADEIVTPLNPDGSYTLTAGTAFGPEAAVWTYTADNPSDFFSVHISSVQRLPNGNTLICHGVDGIFLEVTPEGEVVWRYEYGSAVFRVTKIASDHPGLVGLDLQPDETLEGQKREAEQPSGTEQTQGPSTSPSGSGQDGPPQEAIDACSGLSDGAACSFDTPRGTKSGSCTTIQSDLACMPAGGAQGAEGGPGGQPPQGGGQP